MSARRAAPRLVQMDSAYQAVRRWIWDRVAYEEPPDADEAVEQAEMWIMRAEQAVNTDLSETTRERVMTWLLRRWQRMDRED